MFLGFGVQFLIPKAAVEWLALLLRIRGITSSNFGLGLTNLTDVFHSFLKSFPLNAGLSLKLGHDSFIPCAFKLTIH